MVAVVAAGPQVYDVAVKWLSDYWDGPISGVAEYQGRIVWFHVRPYSIEDENTPPECLLYELTDAEIATEGRRHELFQERVGTHLDQGQTGGTLRPRAEWPQFYDSPLGRQQPDYRDHRVLGWFRLEKVVGRRRPR